MDRAYDSGAAGSAPTPPASPSMGYPTSGNQATATPATKPGEWWYHMITEEIRAVIVAAGLTPDHEDLHQLAQAVVALAVVSDATETVKGKVELATDVEAQTFAAGKVIDGAKLAAAFGGANASLASNGYLRLPGGMIIQWGSNVSIQSGQTITVSFPIAFSSVCLVALATKRIDEDGYMNTKVLSASQFQLKCIGAAFGESADWFAIGY